MRAPLARLTSVTLASGLLLAACASAPVKPIEALPAAEPRPAAPAAPTNAEPAPVVPPLAPAPAAPPAEPARPGCAPYPAEPGERTLSSGGELDLSCVPVSAVHTEGESVIAWGLSEVPGASRLQAALALADAAARAELVASVKVGVASLFRSAGSTTQSGQGEQVVLEKLTAQVASGLLPALPPAQHGWRKVKRGDLEVLIVASKLTAQKRAVQESVEASLWAAQQKEGGSQEAPDVAARRALEALGSGRVLKGKSP